MDRPAWPSRSASLPAGAFGIRVSSVQRLRLWRPPLLLATRKASATHRPDDRCFPSTACRSARGQGRPGRGSRRGRSSHPSAGRRLDRRPAGAGLRPGPRGRGGGHRPGHAGLRRARRGGGGHDVCLRGRRPGRPGGQGLRARGELGHLPGCARRGATVRGRLPRPRVPGLAGRTRGASPPGPRLRAGAGHVPPLRRGQDPSHRRARAPPQPGHPRRDHRRAGRDGRVRPVHPGRLRRLQRRWRERVPGHGGGHRGAVERFAGRGRFAHHPARDPDPSPAGRRHRGPEAVLAPPPGHRRGDGRGGRHRTRLRLGRGRRQGHGHPHRRGLADQRGQDLVHLRGPGRRPHAAGPHRPRPLEDPPGPVHVRGPQAPGRRPRLRVHPGARRRPRRTRRREDGRQADRHHRLPGHALLRDRLRQLVRGCREPGGPRRRAGQAASTTRWPGSRTAGCRPRPGPWA